MNGVRSQNAFGLHVDDEWPRYRHEVIAGVAVNPTADGIETVPFQGRPGTPWQRAGAGVLLANTARILDARHADARGPVRVPRFAWVSFEQRRGWTSAIAVGDASGRFTVLGRDLFDDPSWARGLRLLTDDIACALAASDPQAVDGRPVV